MINQDKKSLRSEYRKIRASVYGRGTKNKTITESVLESEQYKNADKIFAYWSVDSEVDTHDIIAKALSDGKRVALPKCTDKNGNMKFYYIASLADLVDGMYGIKEPPEDFIAEDYTENSLCLVPALAFDKEGYRLGYGKGYYDRFLSDISPYKLGICKKELLLEKLPYSEYDIKPSQYRSFGYLFITICLGPQIQ